jgi:enoyl-CoA hydratase/carnithine racemase
LADQTTQLPELKTMRIEADGEVGILTLDRPDSLNAMNPEMIDEFPIVFGWLADQADFRAVVITGAGPAFCAGGDLTWFRRGIEDPDVDIVAGVRRGAEVLHQGIIDLQRIPCPVIAAINGPAAGAGFSLALACDTRICSSTAFLACAYGRIGASPDGGMTYFLPRVVGPSSFGIMSRATPCGPSCSSTVSMALRAARPSSESAPARVSASTRARTSDGVRRITAKAV